MDAEERARLRENADIWIDDPLEPALVSRDQVLYLLDALDAAEARAARLRGALHDVTLYSNDPYVVDDALAALAATEPPERPADGEAS